MSDLILLFRFLVRLFRGARSARGTLAAVIGFGMVSGFCSAGFIALINTAINSPHRRSLLGGFVALCILLPIFRFTSNYLLIRLSLQAQLDLSLQLCKRFLASPLRQLEQIGSQRLLGALTNDVDAIIGTFTNVPLVLMHATIVLGCLTYLAWLSWPVLLVVLAFMVLGVLSYRLPMAKARQYYGRSRESWDLLLQHYQGLTDGIKELKIHGDRRRSFVEDHLEPTARLRTRDQRLGSTLYSAAATWSQLIFFVLIGLLLFGLPELLPTRAETLTGYTLAILYMLTPIEVILNWLPIVGRGAVAVRKIESLGLSFDAVNPEPIFSDGTRAIGSWQRLELAGVVHTYYREQEEGTFALGPIDLTLEPGEVVFLIGGNGSGKTTLAKILLGLYLPERGEIRLNGKPVTAADLDSYRQLFSVVFSDFFLFNTLLGLTAPDLDARAGHYLSVLHLDRKVTIANGVLSTVDLSQGQRKRLALLTTYLEDRPIFLFDEWAADQDPNFKEIFYLDLLPELKRRGKTVLVISHDDKYYGAADRILKLSDGKIEYDSDAATFACESKEPVRRKTSV